MNINDEYRIVLVVFYLGYILSNTAVHIPFYIEAPRFYHQCGKNIFIQAKPEFRQIVETALSKIESCEVGKRLIDRINNGKHPVWINLSSKSEHDNLCLAIDDNYKNPKIGSSSDIFLALKTTKVFDMAGNSYEMPVFLSLAHELIHAYHNSYGKNAANGDRYPTVDLSLWTTKEEYHTIQGFPSKKGSRSRPKITENAIRRELGFHERFSHLGVIKGYFNNIAKCSRLIQKKIAVFNLIPTTYKRAKINVKHHKSDNPLRENKYHPYLKNIYIQSNAPCPHFTERIKQALDKMEFSEEEKKQLDKIADGAKIVFINYMDPSMNSLSRRINGTSDIFISLSDDIDLAQRLMGI